MRRTAVSLHQTSLDINTFQEKAFFNVQERPAYMWNELRNTFEPVPDKKVITKDDGSYISTVGKNYSIIDNKNYFDTIIENLSDGGVDYEPKAVWVEGNGKRTTMILKLPQFEMYSGTSEAMDMELRIRNSLDTTLAADTVLGFLRLICTNGMSAFHADFEMKMRHKGDIEKKTKEAIELYKDFEGVYQQNKTQIEWLGNTKGDKDKVAAYIGDGEYSRQQVFQGERWARKLQKEWELTGQAINLWQLYNMFTEIISHRYGSNYSSKLQKMDLLNKEVKSWSRMLI